MNKPEKGAKKVTTKGKIVILLQQRNDMTRLKLIEMFGRSTDVALTDLRKAGYKIFPSKGPGSPLRIAESALNSEKYIAHRRRIYLPTARRMIIDEFEIGKQFKELENKPNELTKYLNDTTEDEV